MGIVAKIKKHKTPKSLAKAVARKMARSTGLAATPEPKGKSGRKNSDNSRVDLPASFKLGQQGDNISPLSVHQLSRVSAFNAHSTFTSPKVATRMEDMVTYVARTMAVIVFQSGRGNDLQIGLRSEDFTAFARLCEAFFDTSVAWQGKGFKNLKASHKDFVPKTSKSDTITTTIWFGETVSATVSVTLYSSDEEMTISADNKNADLRYVRGELQDKLDTVGLHFVSDFLGTASAQAVNFPIDVVYTWVNDEDPDWQEIYAVAKAAREEELRLAVAADGMPELGDHERDVGQELEAHQARDDEDDHRDEADTEDDDREDTDGEDLEGSSDTAAMSRFKNRRELKYSLRSVEQYLPWVRKIFVFTNCAMPEWLSETENVVWVRHEDVIPETHLPTFNSHAIESYLHRIPDLAEHFIYFNDDFFVNQSLPVSLFFSSNGVCQSNLEDYGVVNGAQHPEDADYLNAARNCVALIQRDFNMTPTRLHKHSPYAMCKSVMFEMEEKYPEEFERTRLGPFRSATDVSTASFLFHHYGYATRAVAYGGFRSKLVKNTARNLEADFKMMTEESSVRTFCLNDGKDSHDDEYWNTMICEFLEQRFPLPTRAELGISELGLDVQESAPLQQEAAE